VKAKVKASSIVRRVAGGLGLTAVVALAGCGHAHGVEDPSSAAGQSSGRLPDGSGAFAVGTVSPGQPNAAP